MYATRYAMPAWWTLAVSHSRALVVRGGTDEQSLHVGLWLLALILNLTLVGDVIQLTLHILTGIALVIYMPAAMVMVGKKSKNQFTHAGGQVAYVTVQWFFWLSELRNCTQTAIPLLSICPDQLPHS